MNATSHLSNGTRNRAVSVLLCLLGFLVVGIGGLWLFFAVLPSFETIAGGVARFACFVLWLGSLIHLLGRAFFGGSSQLWHGFIFFLLGIPLGTFGGFFFAGFVGCVVGSLSGFLLGLLIFTARHLSAARYLINHDA